MRIFVLDDEIQGYRQGIIAALSSHELAIATTFAEALSAFEQPQPFDVLLLDHDLHGFYESPDSGDTGSELLRELNSYGNWWCPRVLERVFCNECGYPRSEARYANDADQEGLSHNERPKVFLHSQNGPGRASMRSLLEAAGFMDITEMPFSQAYVEHLKTL